MLSLKIITNLHNINKENMKPNMYKWRITEILKNV